MQMFVCLSLFHAATTTTVMSLVFRNSVVKGLCVNSHLNFKVTKHYVRHAGFLKILFFTVLEHCGYINFSNRRTHWCTTGFEPTTIGLNSKVTTTRPPVLYTLKRLNVFKWNSVRRLIHILDRHRLTFYSKNVRYSREIASNGAQLGPTCRYISAKKRESLPQ